ncbi:MAG TPA: MmcQ/YjbR family DNA-binding protein [Chthoniobacterales bacterium]|nr:MmcQ/YjbR family DNA-binding protein [Chthoniobacterales bacterium]
MLPEVVESAHMNHPDFRVGGKIFATLGYPDADSAVVKLPPSQQGELVHDKPTVFAPAAGAWGRRGYTQLYLPKAKPPRVREALLKAWFNTAPKRLKARVRRPTS